LGPNPACGRGSSGAVGRHEFGPEAISSGLLPSAPVAEQRFLYEPGERFGEGLTQPRPWNVAALARVERLNGRVAMLGFAAALIGEWLTGAGPAGQLLVLLRWYLALGTG
jgi:hypothetical protein